MDQRRDDHDQQQSNTTTAARAWRPLLNRIANWALTAAALFAVVNLLVRFIAKDERVGQSATSFEARDVQSGRLTTLPLPEKPQVLVFWATWCGPCSIELGRLQAAVEAGELPASQILAVSLGEEASVVRDHAEKKKYAFPVFADEEGRSGRIFNVHATPTTIHIDKSGKVIWAAAGLHPLSVRKARTLLTSP